MAFIVLGIVLIWAVWMPLCFYCKNRQKRGLSLLFKAAGTLVAVCFAAWGVLAGGGSLYARWIWIGLMICTLADILLDIHFLVGGALFLFGQLVYIAAFLTHTVVWPVSAALFPVITALLILFLRKYRSPLPIHLFYNLHMYAFALSAILSISIPLPLADPSLNFILGALGAVLFVASDMLLLSNSVEKRGFPANFFCLGCYYMGQLSLALSAVL